MHNEVLPKRKQNKTKHIKQKYIGTKKALSRSVLRFKLELLEELKTANSEEKIYNGYNIILKHISVYNSFHTKCFKLLTTSV